jgi:dodecin
LGATIAAKVEMEHLVRRKNQISASPLLPRLGIIALPTPHVPLTSNGAVMTNIVKVVEMLAESPTSWEDAAAVAIKKASETVHGIKSIYIKEFQATVDNDKITSYRINAKVAFQLD